MNQITESQDQQVPPRNRSFNEWLQLLWTTGPVDAPMLFAHAETLEARAHALWSMFDTTAHLPDLASTAQYTELRAHRFVAEQARTIANWMIRAKIQPSTHIGPFGPARPARHEIVIVRAGTEFSFVSDRFISRGILEQPTAVFVFSLMDWHMDRNKIANDDPTAIRQAEVFWKVGGVSHWTDINNVDSLQALRQS